MMPLRVWRFLHGRHGQLVKRIETIDHSRELAALRDAYGELCAAAGFELDEWQAALLAARLGRTGPSLTLQWLSCPCGRRRILR